MPWIPLHQNCQIYWQIYTPIQLSRDALHTATRNLTGLLADLPPQSIMHSCLEYHYTNLGRSTPQSIEQRCLEYHYTKLARSTGRSTPPVNWAEMPWIPVHQTCQIYWQIHPQSIEQRCLEYCYTKLGRFTGRSTPCQFSIDALNTITPDLTDLLADLPPVNQA